MELPVLKRDKIRAKRTAIIFAVFFVLSAVLTVISFLSLPRIHTLKSIGEEGESIRLLLDAKDGSDYFVCSENAIARYDAESDEELFFFSFSSIESFLKERGDGDKLIKNSLKDLNFEYFERGESSFVVGCDSVGNCFKLLDDGVTLTLADDYYMTPKSCTFKRFAYDGEFLYRLIANSDNNMVMEKFDPDNLSVGVISSKNLWSLELSKTVPGCTTIKLLAGNTAVYEFFTDEKYVYIASESGIYKADKDFKDFSDVDYYSSAEQNYIAGLKEYLKALPSEERDLHGLDDETIESLSKTRLESYYTKFSGDSVADYKEEVADRFVNEHEWCESYDPLKQIMVVRNENVDSEKYCVLFSGGYNVGGIVYSQKNEIFYLANRLDNLIYCLNKSSLQERQLGEYISTYAEVMNGINFAGKSFASDYACIRYNKFANSLYVIFSNIKTIAIVDLDNTEQYAISNSLEIGFDIFALCGDKDNRTIHSMRNERVVQLNGNVNTFRYIDGASITKYEHRGISVLFFVLSFLSAVVFLLIAVYFFVAAKRVKVLFRYKKMKRDIKKHKWVYVALIPFVCLLIMSCYYEAIGSISMSFFDYTADKPAMKWNNFANYLIIFNQPDFWLSVKNTLFFLVSDIVLCIVPPLIFAFMLSIIRMKRLSGVLRTLMFIPGIVPGIASMLIWRIGIYGDYGVFNTIIGFFGGESVQFLANPDISRWSLIFMGFPFVGGYLIFYGGIMNIPKEYYEACDLEGLNIFKRFFKIDIPLIMPQIRYIFIMTIISSVQNYSRTYMLKSSGTVTIVENMYITMNSSTADYGLASAYATLLFVFLFLAVLANFKLQKKNTLGDSL